MTTDFLYLVAWLYVYGALGLSALVGGAGLSKAYRSHRADRLRNMYAPPADVAEWRAVHHRGGQR